MAQQPTGFIPDGFVPDTAPPLEPQVKPPIEHPGTSTALTISTAAGAVPRAAGWATELATNPDAWKTGKAIGETVGGIGGLIKAGPIGAASGMYAGGKAGWRLTNALQRMSTPIADALSKASPYAEAVGRSPVLAAQGALDLTQMAEPNRRDIGVLGVGHSTMPIDPAHVPVMNAAIAKALDALGYKDLAKQFRGEH